METPPSKLESKPAVQVAGQAPTAGNDPTKTRGSVTISAPFQIQPIGGKDKFIKALVYGRHGAGKTELFATAVDVPEMNDVLMLSAESGEATIMDSPRVKNADKIFTIRVTNFKQIGYIQNFLANYTKATAANNIPDMAKMFSMVSGIPKEDLNESNLPRFKTVIIDSLTEIEAFCMYGLLKMDPDKLLTSEKLGDMEVAEWGEYRRQYELIKLLVRTFRDLPMNVLIVCAEQYQQDELKRYHYSPQLTGKLATGVQGFVDVVAWLTVAPASMGEGDEATSMRRLFVQPVVGTGIPKFAAKNRKSVYSGTHFDNPNMQKIMQAFKLVG